MKNTQYEKKIGYTFKDRSLLEKALVHSSYAYEKLADTSGDNETLEFLGDSVVGLAVADFFFTRYPDLAEGDLSKLKSTAASTLSLSDLAEKIKLDKAIYLGKGEEKSGGRRKKTILAGAFEALVGAIYLDGGFEAAKAFVSRQLTASFKAVPEEFSINNYKSALQELFQKSELPSPSYHILAEKGPDHSKVFVVDVRLAGESLAKAEGHSRKNAEQRAAQKALKSILGRKMKVLTPESFIVRKPD